MSQDRTPMTSASAPTEFGYRFFAPLMATAFFEQVVVSLMRVTTSYRAVELELSVVWLGLITTAFAVLPMLLAVSIGRYIDRGRDTRTARAGSVLMMSACAGFALLPPSLITLLVFTALLGLSHLMLVISQQVLCTRGASGTLDRMLGNYMVANAVGQGVGPSIVGWVGGSAAVPPTDVLFTIGFALSALALVPALLLRTPAAPAKTLGPARPPTPLREILRLPGLHAIFLVSVVTVAAQDLIVVYMPLLGAERGLSVDAVGMLLAVRAGASMLSRYLYARLNEILGRRRLTIASTVASAVAYAGLAVPFPLALMHVVIAAAGFFIGISITVSIASLLGLAAADARGTANSLRMMGNRVGQFVIPFLASLIAAATGIGGIFLVIGLSLAASGTAVHAGQRKSRSEAAG
jgi:MFS family permease